MHTETNSNRSDEIFRLLVDEVEDYAIFALSPEGIIQTWNQGAQRLKGYKPEEVIGSHIRRFYTPVDVARLHPENELKLAAATGKYEEEGWRIRKDGTQFWANVVITALRDEKGNLRGFGKVTRDLTAKRRNELALRESEERFRLMVESVEDYAIFMLSPEGKVTTWNRGAERNKGFRAEEIIGQHFSQFYPEEEKKLGKPAKELEIALREGRFEDEGWRVRKDGSTFWANVVISPMFDPERKLLGFSKVTRNLTERKKSEDSMRAANFELEAKVELRTRELSEAKGRAEQAVRARDEFFSIASHELKTPLTSLKLQTQFRKRRVEKGDFSSFDQEKLLELSKSDERQIDRLVFLVDNLLDISRVNSGSFELSLSGLNLGEVVRDVVTQLEPILRETGNEIRENIDASVEGVWDRHRLEQIVTNLLSNAGKYAPGKPIEITVSGNANQATIEVKDHGPGIAEKNLDRIFEPFQRIANAQGIAGLGLGLHITKQIVEGHGGSLTVVSKLGLGTSFTVVIPLRSDQLG